MMRGVPYAVAVLVGVWLMGALAMTTEVGSQEVGQGAAGANVPAREKVARHRFPRIMCLARLDIRENVRDLAKADQIVDGIELARDREVREACEQIRRLNPDILFVAYRAGIAIGKEAEGLSGQVYEVVEQNDLFLRDVDGEPMLLWYRADGNHSYLINKYKNDFQFCREYARLNCEGLDWSFWDGIHYDSLNTAGAVPPRSGYGYSASKRIDADVDEDGEVDDAAWACKMWLQANRLILRETARLMGPDKILENNNSFAGMNYSYSNNDANGSRHENCFKGPYGNDGWLAELTGLWKTEKLTRQPPVNVLVVEHNQVSKMPTDVRALVEGALTTEVRRRDAESNVLIDDRGLRAQVEEGLRTDWHFMRYGLTSCLLSDAYFQIDIGGPPFGHATTVWWYDEFDNAGEGKGYLGFPTGKAQEVGTHPWLREEDFENENAAECWEIKASDASWVRDEELVLDGGSSLISPEAVPPGFVPAFLESVPGKLGLEPNTTYVLEFDFRVVEEVGRDFYVSLYTYEEGERKFPASLLAFREDKGYAGSAIASFTTRPEGETYLGFHVRNWPEPAKGTGRLVLDNIKVRRLGAWRRDYDNGIVLCNPTSTPVSVELGGQYRKIRGEQCPEVNDGSLVDTVVLPPYDGLILLKIAE